MAKTLLIGWDAADWQMINPLIEKGYLPTLAKLKAEGVYGNLATLQPPLSPVLWTSIATGKRAYDHGIHGFVQVDPVTARIEAVRVSQRKSKAIWNILNEAGLKTNVVNWWPSHPAEAVNGIYVSNRFHQGAPLQGQPWPLKNSTVWPPEWEERLAELRLHPAELTLAHVLPFIEEAHQLDPEKDKVLKPLMRILAHACSIHNAATEIEAHSEWDFMAVYQEAIDHFGHLAMKYHPPQLKGISTEAFKRYQNIMTAAYRFHDMMLERLLGLAGPDTNVVLLSDHGFHSGQQRTARLPDVPAAPALEHRRFGVFLAYGPAFKQGEQVYGASLLDISPTLLQLHHLPVGEDMEGRVLQDVFKQPEPLSSIESWEHTAATHTLMEGEKDGQAEQEVLGQLAEIGYVELPEKEKQAYVAHELKHNLIQSLVDGHKWEQAEREARQLYEKAGDVRTAKVLLHIAHKRVSTDLFDKTLAALEEQLGNAHPDVLYFTGLRQLRENRFPEALSCFLQLEEAGGESVQLYLQIAQALFLSQKFEKASAYAGKALSLDPDVPAALTLRGQSNEALGRAEAAVEDLLESIQLQFFQPTAHFVLAKLWVELGRGKEAKEALGICLRQAPKHLAAKRLLATLKDEKEFSVEKEKAIIVVSGLPRSGTSMLMHMLAEGGMRVFTDDTRPADAHNPLGYFEAARIKKLPQQADWLEEAEGKAIKVVSPLLRYLPPDYTYYILKMERPLMEVLLSQEKMKGRTPEEILKNFPFKLAVDFEEEEKRLDRWLQSQPNVQVLKLSYQDCVANPLQAAANIKAFLPIPVNEKKAAAAIKPGLYRNKLA